MLLYYGYLRFCRTVGMFFCKYVKVVFTERERCSEIDIVLRKMNCSKRTRAELHALRLEVPATDSILCSNISELSISGNLF